jgi:hypothetical protein
MRHNELLKRFPFLKRVGGASRFFFFCFFLFFLFLAQSVPATSPSLLFLRFRREPDFLNIFQGSGPTKWEKKEKKKRRKKRKIRSQPFQPKQIPGGSIPFYS